MTISLLTLLGFAPDRLAAFKAAGYTVVEGKKFPNRAEAIRAAGDTVRAVLTNGRMGLSGEDMGLLPKLEIICTIGAGYESVDLNTARSRNIAVTRCIGTNSSSVADHALMLLLAANRHVRAAELHIRAGGWQEDWRADTQIISGKRLGIVGMGTIGGMIAHRAARGFDMEVGYHNRKAVAGAPYRYFDTVPEMAKWADFLVCSAPGGAGTRHLVNAEALAALGPKGYLVNVGRGTIVDTAALLDALRSKRIAGAGLDVLEGEPAYPPNVIELLGFDNVVITPHGAGRAPEARTAATDLVIANLNAHFSGKPLLTPVPAKM